MKTIDKFKFIFSISAIIISIINIVILYNIHTELQGIINSNVKPKYGKIEIKKNYSESNILSDFKFER